MQTKLPLEGLDCPRPLSLLGHALALIPLAIAGAIWLAIILGVAVVIPVVAIKLWYGLW